MTSINAFIDETTPSPPVAGEPVTVVVEASITDFDPFFGQCVENGFDASLLIDGKPRDSASGTTQCGSDPNTVFEATVTLPPGDHPVVAEATVSTARDVGDVTVRDKAGTLSVGPAFDAGAVFIPPGDCAAAGGGTTDVAPGQQVALSATVRNDNAVTADATVVWEDGSGAELDRATVDVDGGETDTATGSFTPTVAGQDTDVQSRVVSASAATTAATGAATTPALPGTR